MKRARADSGENFVPLRKAPRYDGATEEPSMQPYGGMTGQFTDLNEQKIDELRFSCGIRVEGEDVPAPVQQFQDLHLPPFLTSFLQQQGYLTPTPVQMQAIPTLLAGRDGIVIAQTGSGKTLAYSLPLTVYLSRQTPVSPGGQPCALIVVPARELACQVKEEVDALMRCIPRPPPANPQPLQTPVQCPPPPPPPSQSSAPYSAFQQPGAVVPPALKGYTSLALFGGVSAQDQMATLRGGVDVLVACPGRLLHLCEWGALSLDSIAYLVMDEADLILNQGFEDQLRKIVGMATSSNIARQTTLWSATMPESLERLARSAVVRPVTIHVGYAGLTAHGIKQNIIFLHHYQKMKRLLAVLRLISRPPVLVFCSSKDEVDEVVEKLSSEQFHVAALHGRLPQASRTAAIDAFKNDQCDILVATDVASRGINVPCISHVINYTLPSFIDDYIHRCGRTSRMGVGGETTSFLTLDCKIAKELRDVLEESEQPIPLELEDVKRFGKRVIITEFGDRLANA